MKNIADIQRAHDIFSTRLARDRDLTKEQQDLLLGARNALCWVLEHEPAKTEMSRWLTRNAVEYGVTGSGGTVH
jgi:hypothetical protein